MEGSLIGYLRIVKNSFIFDMWHLTMEHYFQEKYKGLADKPKR